MTKRPLVASRPWTPAEDEKLRALAALGERPTTIAEQLQRSATAIQHRFYKLGLTFKRVRMTERTFATHPERQFMEYLRRKGWVKGTTLPTSRLTASLQKKDWIEQQLQGPKNETFYRMTDVGLAALKAPVPIQAGRPQDVSVGKLGLKAKEK
jgi:Myb-like DNA-binding domain